MSIARYPEDTCLPAGLWHEDLEDQVVKVEDRNVNYVKEAVTVILMDVKVQDSEPPHC